MSRKVKHHGTGYSGPDSVHPSQPQESDYANEGGTQAGGTVAPMGSTPQWGAPGAAQWGAGAGAAEVSDGDAAAALAQGHPKSKKVPLLKDRANVIGGFGSQQIRGG